MYLYFEFCTFKIVSQNTLQKVNFFNAFINGGLISLTLFIRVTE